MPPRGFGFQRYAALKQKVLDAYLAELLLAAYAATVLPGCPIVMGRDECPEQLYNSA